MRRFRATVLAVLATMAAYLAIAWLASAVIIPAAAPSARSPWFRPFRVIAEIGFVLASVLHMPHVAGQLIAAILIGAALGAIFAAARHAAR